MKIGTSPSRLDKRTVGRPPLDGSTARVSGYRWTQTAWKTLEVETERDLCPAVDF